MPFWKLPTRACGEGAKLQPATRGRHRPPSRKPFVFQAPSPGAPQRRGRPRSVTRQGAAERSRFAEPSTPHPSGEVRRGCARVVPEACMGRLGAGSASCAGRGEVPPSPRASGKVRSRLPPARPWGFPSRLWGTIGLLCTLTFCGSSVAVSRLSDHMHEHSPSFVRTPFPDVSY